MDIKVRVSEKRKCAASIDWEAGKQLNEIQIQKLAILSFGDLKTPDTDVEILCTLPQLRKMNAVISRAIKNFEKEKHYGQC